MHYYEAMNTRGQLACLTQCLIRVLYRYTTLADFLFSLITDQLEEPTSIHTTDYSFYHWIATCVQCDDLNDVLIHTYTHTHTHTHKMHTTQHHTHTHTKYKTHTHTHFSCPQHMRVEIVNLRASAAVPYQALPVTQIPSSLTHYSTVLEQQRYIPQLQTCMYIYT